MIRTRIAPSPTGIAHIGTAWLSMFNLALARQSGGQFIIRIEDTDRVRFVPEAEAKIYEGLKWLGIDYDEGGIKGGPHEPYHQSERLEIYQKYAKQLIENGWAYYCFATKDELEQMRKDQIARGDLPKYDGRWREADKEEVKKRLDNGESYVIRLKVPKGRIIKWTDLIRGEVEFKTDLIDDQVLIKGDGFPTYHLAVVVDDYLMKITHILRGEEWISSTPKHLLLYEAFGWEVPAMAHMPLIRNKDKSKISKRKNDVSILSYREKGYLPEAVTNFVALLGWSHPEGEEIFSLNEFLEVMTLERVQKTGPVFDWDKLNWYNGYYIRKMVQDRGMAELAKKLIADGFVKENFPVEKMELILPLIYERLVTLADFSELSDFFWQEIVIDKKLLLKKADEEIVSGQLMLTKAFLETINWSKDKIEEKIRSLTEEKNYKKNQYFMMLRIAVTGKTATPPLFETMEILGKEKTIQRLSQAIKIIKENHAS